MFLKFNVCQCLKFAAAVLFRKLSRRSFHLFYFLLIKLWLWLQGMIFFLVIYSREPNIKNNNNNFLIQFKMINLI